MNRKLIPWAVVTAVLAGYAYLSHSTAAKARAKSLPDVETAACLLIPARKDASRALAGLPADRVRSMQEVADKALAELVPGGRNAIVGVSLGSNPNELLVRVRDAASTYGPAARHCLGEVAWEAWDVAHKTGDHCTVAIVSSDGVTIDRVKGGCYLPTHGP